MTDHAGNPSAADGVRSAPRQPSEPGGQGVASLRSAPSPAPHIKDEAELLAFINDTPVLQSLLYDLNLLPEQHMHRKRTTPEWWRIFTIANHMKAALANRNANRPSPGGRNSDLEQEPTGIPRE